MDCVKLKVQHCGSEDPCLLFSLDNCFTSHASYNYFVYLYQCDCLNDLLNSSQQAMPQNSKATKCLQICPLHKSHTIQDCGCGMTSCTAEGTLPMGAITCIHVSVQLEGLMIDYWGLRSTETTQSIKDR